MRLAFALVAALAVFFIATVAFSQTEGSPIRDGLTAVGQAIEDRFAALEARVGANEAEIDELDARVSALENASSSPPPPPPPSEQGTQLTFTDTYWRCTQPIADLATDGLPLRVTMLYTQPFVPPTGAGAVQFGAGCLGDANPATVDVVLDIRGDGLTFGPGDDAIRVMNALPGASDLVISGHADCGPQAPGAHQDGVQVLGGTNLTFRDFTIGDYEAGLSTCQGAGGAFFYSLTSSNVDVEGGSYIACNHSLFAGTSSPGGEVSNARFRSGRTDGSDPKCVGYAASNPCIDQSDVTFTNLVCQRWIGGQWENRP